MSERKRPTTPRNPDEVTEQLRVAVELGPTTVRFRANGSPRSDGPGLSKEESDKWADWIQRRAPKKL